MADPVNTETPTLDIVGAIRFTDPTQETSIALSGGLEGASRIDPHNVEMDPGETDVVVSPAKSPATFLHIVTAKPIRIQLNGGSEYITVQRHFLLIGTSITQVELHNDQLATPKRINVDVRFAAGGTVF